MKVTLNYIHFDKLMTGDMLPSANEINEHYLKGSKTNSKQATVL